MNCPKCEKPTAEEARDLVAGGLVTYMGSLCSRHHQEALDSLSREEPFEGAKK